MEGFGRVFGLMEEKNWEKELFYFGDQEIIIYLIIVFAEIMKNCKSAKFSNELLYIKRQLSKKNIGFLCLRNFYF